MFIGKKPHKKAREIRAFLCLGPGVPYWSYFLRDAAAESHPIPPNMVVETRMSTNTAIGTIIAIKNSPQNSSPIGELGKNQSKVYPIDWARASSHNHGKSGYLY